MKNGVLVLVEQINGVLADITFELLGAGRYMANSLNLPLGAVVIGKETGNITPQLGIVDKIYAVEDEDIEVCNPVMTASILKKIIRQNDISYIILGGTNLSSGIGPILASNINYPFINFCKHLNIEESKVVVSCQLFGGKILVDLKLETNKGIISIYPGAFTIESGKSDMMAAIEKIEYEAEALPCKFMRYIQPEAGDVDITKQDILVSIGRGIENEDNIELADDLVEILGGAVSASRPVIDQGWLPLNRQVGKSGMSVKPKLYLALGISGAPEHVEGMKDSELIIAINKDPSAPIFNVAHYGVCGDMHDIVPQLIQQLRERKK